MTTTATSAPGKPAIYVLSVEIDELYYSADGAPPSERNMLEVIKRSAETLHECDVNYHTTRRPFLPATVSDPDEDLIDHDGPEDITFTEAFKRAGIDD